MNMQLVQEHEGWKTAPKECRSEFIEAMRDVQYGAQETMNAWYWFANGWHSSDESWKRAMRAEERR